MSKPETNCDTLMCHPPISLSDFYMEEKYAILYLTIFGEHKPGSGQSSLVVLVLVNVVVVSLGLSVASCFLPLAIIKIFQARKAKLTITKKQKHIARTMKNGVNSKIKV